MGHPPENEPCCGCFIGAQRNEKLPVLSYIITKISTEQTEFVNIQKTLNREECVCTNGGWGAVVNNFQGSDDVLKTISKIM